MKPTQEAWRAVIGYEGQYEVSDQGRVRNRATGRILRPSRSGGSPYFKVTLHRPASGKKTHRIHRLVAAAFLGPCPPGLEVRHVDSNSSNNTLSNLAYGTKAENAADMPSARRSRCGRQPGFIGTTCRAGHELTGDNLRLRVQHGRPARVCKECQRGYRRRHREKHHTPSAA